MSNLYELIIKEKFKRREYYESVNDYNLEMAIGTKESQLKAKEKMDKLKDEVDDLVYRIEEAKWRQRGR